jgi:nicotinamidase-related amidase
MAAALIIIDMQRGMLPENTGPRNNPAAEDNIERLLAAWRAAARPIVHVRHMSRSPAGAFWPGSPNCEFQPRFQPLPSEHRMEKNVPDAFAGSGLERWLRVRGVGNLVVIRRQHQQFGGGDSALGVLPGVQRHRGERRLLRLR